MPGVGSKLEETVLADFKVIPPKEGLAGDHSVEMNTYDAAGQLDGDFCYLDDTQAEIFGVEAGWYTAASVEEWDPISADKEVIEFGRGVCIMSDCGATVTFAGEVNKASVSVSINSLENGGFTFTGNCTPVAVALKDLGITPPEGGLAGDHSVEMNTYDAAGQLDGDFCYLDDTQAEIFGVEAGWYTAASVEEWDPISAGEEIIAAGSMFCIMSDCGATITIPSAL